MSIYSILPLISGISVLILGLLVLGKNRKSKLNQVFFWAILCVAVWLFATFMLFSSGTDEQAIFWDRVVYIGVVFIPVTFYHFGLLVAKIKTQRKLLYLGYFLSFIFLILSRTDYFVNDLYKYSWGVHTQARFFHNIFLFFFIFYIFLFFFNTYQYRRKIKGIERSQANYILLALFILSISSLAFLPAYGIDIPPFSYLFAVICVLVFSFTILKYHLFEIKVILTEILVGVMGIILFVLPFLMPTGNLKILTALTFILFLIFGYLLIKATHEESKRREEAETLAIREKSLREKTEKIAQDFQRLNEVRKQMFLTGQHHSRTPLSHIKNISSLLLEDVYGPLTKEQKWGVKVIFEKVQEAIDVTNLYLSVAELETGQAIISKEKIDLVQLVKEQIKKILYGANQKGIEVITELQKDLPKIKADAEKMGTVFYTVLDNGVKYSPQKGKLVIILKKLENKYILFSCQDSGIGLSKEEISELGKIPYQRSKRARSAHGMGIGLALYLSNLIIRGHGAELWAESEGPGKGTTFNVKIPID